MGGRKAAKAAHREETLACWGKHSEAELAERYAQESTGQSQRCHRAGLKTGLLPAAKFGCFVLLLLHK